MSKFAKAIDSNNDILYHFYCPGCKEIHGIYVGRSVHPVWAFNDDVDNPTVSPSIKVTYPANPNAIEEFKEWRVGRICHSFIKNGKIQFLNDCWHDLKGKTVDLPEFPY